MKQVNSYGGYEIGGKTWGRLNRSYGISPGNFPYGNGPDDVIMNEIDNNVDINDEQDSDAWKQACKLIEKRFGEIA